MSCAGSSAGTAFISRIRVSSHQDVGAEAKRQRFALVQRWNTGFAPHRNASTLQVPAQRGGVKRFQQPRTTMAGQPGERRGGGLFPSCHDRARPRSPTHDTGAKAFTRLPWYSGPGLLQSFYAAAMCREHAGIPGRRERGVPAMYSGEPLLVWIPGRHPGGRNRYPGNKGSPGTAAVHDMQLQTYLRMSSFPVGCY
jgi:hypothetical protein